ncbi:MULTISPECIES: aldehyde dehydrogenase family protein [Catenuloplanes]|uniref:Aldehyde dehydrogenase (NAD+) n=1 Tax=Catenuloplanes niger TaxID=587534 RepID=A0AAE3ZNG5_9ACTN|nr:aldehyde dehydrogenase family protein [Catenuloplanes niger]MDR7321075.1 aldehyde dehydrogenase (NAD+) [Catenuloplanes niger]
MLIDGKLVESGSRFANISPTTEEIIGYAEDATAADMDAAIAAARRAFDGTDWATDHAFRRHCLTQLGDAIRENAEELRRIDVAELGVPVTATGLTVDTMLPRAAQLAELAETYGYERPLPNGAGILRREAVGVVAAVLTWNCGFFLWIEKVLPALAAGNTVVVRPAPETPWGSTFIARLIAERTDIPAGVVNVVTSSSPALAVQLTEDPRVDMVSFTGSTAVGRRVMAQAAGTVKKLVLELGGKSANIVLDDGDLRAAVATTVGQSCAFAGEMCGMLSRLLLPRSRYEEGIALAAAMMRDVEVGDPADPATRQGPQISAAHRDRILGLIATARAEGARVVVGGGVPDVARGFYVQQTLLADVDPDSTIAQTEVFGPVVCVIPVADDDEAVRVANNSVYGLNGAVWSADRERALSVARRVRTGTISVNGAHYFQNAPLGGYKQSGLGRETGLWGFEEFLETKAIGVS